MPTGFYSATQKVKRGQSLVEVESASVGCVFARNKVTISGKVNDCNCSCVNYFLQLNLIQIAKRGKWKVSDESDHKVLMVLFTNNFEGRSGTFLK